MKITFIAVGGTIDKVYFDKKSTYEVGKPNVKSILKDLNVGFSYQITSVLRKDSLDMTDKDRLLVFKKIKAEKAKHIIITHGTDTMVETAKALLSIKGKTIVLTGAMEPALFKTSDAIFNVGCAIAAVQALEPGVYITMNGQIFNPQYVRKNVKQRRFEEI